MAVANSSARRKAATKSGTSTGTRLRTRAMREPLEKLAPRACWARMMRSASSARVGMNRRAIVDEILARMDLTARDRFTTIHNYIDLDSMILRKGAISARKGERVLIPINMRDGSLICIGKGNEDWNYSAPHGAGRIMSRREAKKAISLEEYEKTMEGIYSTTVNRSTLDECALAYKPMDEIIGNIRDTVEIIEIIKPVYNFKAAE